MNIMYLGKLEFSHCGRGGGGGGGGVGGSGSGKLLFISRGTKMKLFQSHGTLV